MSIVQLYLEMEVNNVELAEQGLSAIVEKTQSDNGVLSYQFFFNADKSRIFGFEIYRNAAALGAHMQHIGAELAKVMEAVTLARTVIGGSVPDALKEGFAAFQPTYINHIGGFTRG